VEVLVAVVVLQALAVAAAVSTVDPVGVALQDVVLLQGFKCVVRTHAGHA